MQLKTLNSSFVKNKTVLLKVDYSVPLKEENGAMVVADDTRIQDSLKTINFLLKNNCKIVITSKLGRPGGKVVKKMSLKPTAQHLGKLLNKPIVMVDEPAGKKAEEVVKNMNAGEIVMLENSRFHPGEKKNDLVFAKQLASLADVFVNEGFSVSHRAHSSGAGVAKYLPAVAGFAFQKEVEKLSKLIDNPKHPFVAVVGGAKISDKIEAIRSLSKIADVVLVGGGVANNFLKAEGIEVFHSYLEEKVTATEKKKSSFVAVAEELIDQNKTEKMLLHGYIPLPKIIYPSDVIAGEKMENPKTTKVLDLTNGGRDEKNKNWMYLDIGPKTQKLYRDIISEAQTVFWNGPMGVFEQKDFAGGTKAVAKEIARSSGHTVVGGGDTISAINNLGMADRYDYISAAGGASLEFLSGKILPGIKPLLKK